jgi:hypothetical protein
MDDIYICVAVYFAWGTDAFALWTRKQTRKLKSKNLLPLTLLHCFTLSAILPNHAHATHRMQAIVQHDEQQHEESLEAALALTLEESIEDVEEASDGSDASREQAARAPTGPSLSSAATVAAKDDGMDVKLSPSMPSAFNILPDVRASLLPLFAVLLTHLLHAKHRTSSAVCSLMRERFRVARSANGGRGSRF